MNFGEKIRDLRNRQNVSQEELANALGYKSFTTIQKWESGDSKPHFSKITQIAEFFGVSADYFINSNSGSQENSLNTIDEITALRFMKQLNREGQKRVSDYAEELTHNSLYALRPKKTAQLVADRSIKDDGSDDQVLSESSTGTTNLKSNKAKKRKL